MADKYKPTDFSDLPNELLLHIVENFHAIRSYETQSEAFRFKEHEEARQRENFVRQCSLHALSLTSQKLHGICEPILYSAFISSTSKYGSGPLHSFHRTLVDRPALALSVQYIENRLSDFRGNNLIDDTDSYEADAMVKDYFETLAAVINRAANLKHLSVVSLETVRIGLWPHLVENSNQLPRLATHGFPKLEIMCVQLHTSDYMDTEEPPSWFRPIANGLLSVPTLKQFRISGATPGSVGPIPGKFESLDTLEITECMLGMHEILQIISECTTLKHFGCHWAFLNDRHVFPARDFHAALLDHKRTLEYVRLDTRQVRIYGHNQLPVPLGSLREFTSLRTVELCEGSLLAFPLCGVDTTPIRIAHLLPESLEFFTIFCAAADLPMDEARVLWDLFWDCPTLLPNLKEVQLQSQDRFHAEELETAFNEVGVKLSVIREA